MFPKDKLRKFISKQTFARPRKTLNLKDSLLLAIEKYRASSKL